MTPDVSICIASYRRPDGLERLLSSLTRQKLPDGLGFEVLVVDNDADRSAAPVLERFRQTLPLRELEEPRRNIAHARNAALDEARGHWIAFIDDDEEADEGWLAAYWERACEDEADGWFGPVLPRLEEVVTPWLDAEAFYARPRFHTGAVVGRESAGTCNAFVRRTQVGKRRFDPAFGLSGGEDTEIFWRMLCSGAAFRWCDEARVVETVPAERHRPGWLARRAFRGGVASTRIERRLGRAGWLAGIRAVAAFGACAVAALFSAPAGRAHSAFWALRACTQLGHLWALLGGDYEEYGSAT